MENKDYVPEEDESMDEDFDIEQKLEIFLIDTDDDCTESRCY